MVGFVAAGAMLTCAAGLFAQTTQPVQQPDATIPYSDPTFGFEMQVPAWWTYDRARFQGPEGSIGLLRGRNENGSQALQILVFRDSEMTSFDKWLDEFEVRLGQLHGKGKIAEKKRERRDRPRALLIVDPQTAGTRTRTHYLCIPFDPNTVWVLVFAATLSQPVEQDAVRTQFDTLAASVRVLYDPLEVEQIAAAFDRGLAVLRELRTGAAAVEIDETERYYDLSIEGKSIGYLTRALRRETQTLSDPRVSSKRKDGLRVREESWRFAADGTVRYTELNLFGSFDLRSELVENRTTQVPAPDVASQRLYIELDQCVREDRTLFSSYTTNVDVDLPDPRPPIPIGPRYLSLAWARLLPQLLLKAPANTYAFAVYDSQIRALTVHTIRPLGPCDLPGPPKVSGFAFETRDGFVTQPSKLYTDEHGNLVRVESGDLILTPTTRDEVDRKYGQRRAAARRRIEPASPSGTTP